MSAAQFTGRVAVITGAASGIGRTTARLLASRGAKVCCADINEEGAAATVERIESVGGTAFAHKVDITQPDQNVEMVEAIEDRYGALHLAHLNAGIPSPKQISIESMPIEDWDRVFAINMRGTFLGIQACSKAIAKAGGGAMVLMSSLSGLRVASPGTAAYVSSKHGLIGLAKVAAVDLSAMRIRVNVVCPGTVDTELFSARFGDPESRREVLERRSARIPLRRIGETEDIAKLVAFLLSDEAAFITGAVHSIDGGVSATSGSLQTLPDIR